MTSRHQLTALVTGATDGLGRRLVHELTARGLHVVAHGRNPERLKAVRADTGADVVRADFAELRQVERLADELLQRYDRFDVLVNNAGVGTGGNPHQRRESHDGYELRLAVNYLATYHLTRRVLPLLRAPARIVNIASAGQQEFNFADPQLHRRYNSGGAYMQSKLALVMFTVDLAAQLHGSGITVNALHPATLMDTAMVRESGRRPQSTLDDGVAATLRLVCDDDLAQTSGRFFSGLRETTPHPQAYQPRARQRLRELTDDLVAGALR